MEFFKQSMFQPSTVCSLASLRLALLVFLVEAMSGCWLVEQPSSSILRFHPRVMESFALFRATWLWSVTCHGISSHVGEWICIHGLVNPFEMISIVCHESTFSTGWFNHISVKVIESGLNLPPNFRIYRIYIYIFKSIYQYWTKYLLKFISYFNMIDTLEKRFLFHRYFGAPPWWLELFGVLELE